MKKKFIVYYPSPLGVLKIISDGKGITALTIVEEAKTNLMHPILHEAVQQLAQYFQGKRKQFRLPLQPEGTPFQQKVWAALQEVPHGTVISYKALALKLGDEKLVRAVANANARNPVAILIPCHRVIGSGGQLTGYAWGLEKKAVLLQLEKGIRQGALPL
ncbi:methylated-DNA--[protein]-cysteine S-methyltransferase [Persicobacter psychrovividus]|uniref:Methylated-DNA--protein-cysteine methyltransferase n=1 Tax=Persicobacter psychrovividus TaxID=387638 RepID=A0ABN6L4R2_9BACT|nr:methylated-DNA--protein-cysteine methyltransferase [Persicobacter psychrovividus]